MASYQEILEDLCHRTENSDSPEVLRKVLKNYEDTGIAVAAGMDADENDEPKSSENRSENKKEVVLPYHPKGLTDLLVQKLMVVSNQMEIEDETMSTSQAMAVAKALVESLPGVYLQALATSVSDLVSTIPHDNIVIGTTRAPGLLRLWVSLIAYSPLQVHELLSESLIMLLGKQRVQEDASDAMEYLVEDWKKLLGSGGNSSEAVRCAVVLVKWVSRLPFLSVANSSGATDLFVQMLGNFEDPLQQLSLLDALIQEFDTSKSKISSATDEWLASPPLMSLVLQLLKDPLLADAALRYVGILSAVRPTEIATVLDHVKQVVAENGGDLPTRDTERLPLINALSTMAMSSSEVGLTSILSDSVLRRSWWDTDRIAQPKLKAAILVSVAQALPVVEESFGASKALELYKLVGEDHQRGAFDNDTTTYWLLTKMASSPLVEVKIASMALLAAAIRIENAAMTILGVLDKPSHASLVELLLSSNREPTVHAQSARYDLLTAFWEAIEKHPSLEENPKVLQKLREKVGLGAHGQKPLQHGSDEMQTA